MCVCVREYAGAEFDLSIMACESLVVVLGAHLDEDMELYVIYATRMDYILACDRLLI